MKKIMFLMLVSVNFFASAFAGDCYFDLKQQNLSGKLEWLTAPMTSASFPDSPYTLKLWQTGIAVNEATGPFQDPTQSTVFSSIVMKMGSMEHGGRGKVVLSKHENKAGFYDASNVIFTMAGKWTVKIQIKNLSGIVIDEATCPVLVVQGEE